MDGQGGFSGAADADNGRDLSQRYIDVDIFQIVGANGPYPNVIFHGLAKFPY
jgi:hypothetical protein